MPAPEKVPQPVAQIRSTQEVPQPAALLPAALLWSVPWAHHVILIEYAGKLNFYCNVVNDRLKRPDDQPTIGLILCQERGRLLAEYSFAGIDKPIGISTYELTRALPRELRSALPTVEEIEAELSGKPQRRAKRKK
jgi:hypothetical protein